jgi:hypothetical protein
MQYDIDDLHFVFSTNESNSHLAELAVHQLLLHAKRDNLKVTVISNKYKEGPLMYGDKVNYISSGIEFDPYGGHFTDTMIQLLPTIKEKYIFFFCDDYMMVDDIKWDDIHAIMNMIRSENIDYFGFDDAMDAEVELFPMYEKEHEGIPSGILRWRDPEYRYICSVQAAIWKKSALLHLIEKHNPNLHALDDTWPDVRESARSLRMLYHTLHSCFTHTELWYPPPHDRPDVPHYVSFGIGYVEIVRHGVFLHPKNGWGITTECRTKLIDKLIEEFDLLNNPKFYRLLEHMRKNDEN